MGKFRMPRKAPQSLAADMAFADVPVPVDPRIVGRARVVEMHCANVSQADRSTNNLQRCFQPVGLAYVVPGGERMRGVDANTQAQFGTQVHDGAQVFEAM